LNFLNERIIGALENGGLSVKRIVRCQKRWRRHKDRHLAAKHFTAGLI
jgi:polyferredoxin